TGKFIVEEPEMLFTPVNKNDEGITDDVTHLLRYDIEPVDDDEEIEVIGNVVENQFGTFTVDVQGPDFLLVPTSKALLGEDLPELPGTVDHFTCYELEEVEFEKVVTLEDQFGKADFEVENGKWLCNPVEKTVENEDGTTTTTPIQNPDAHLMCFEVEGPEPDVEVHTDNQFGPESFEVGQPELLCLPSEKTPGETTEGDDGDGSSSSAVSGLPVSDWVFTGWGYVPTFATIDNSDPNTELCYPSE
ncbi:MAG: hypothetical protein ACE5JL_13595, partial [Dehalococcoidia bacterium]